MKYQQEPFSECENIILEAKRVLLNEQLDRIANNTLSEDITTSKNIIYDNTGCENPADYFNITAPVDSAFIENSPKPLNKDSEIKIELVSNKIILRKYFQKWRRKTKGHCYQEQKLNVFINNLKNHHHTHSECSENKQTKSFETPKPLGCFKNRYKSQKYIINMQRSKIEEQAKIISELKLGIIREDLIKSMENTKIQIREIFSNCSEKVLLEAPLLQAAEEREKMMIHSQKAPKIFQKMHERAIERAKYREIILERKRIIEETRQKLLEEAIEKKKALEEAERKRNLEIINEQRKREVQLQKYRNEKRRQLEKKLMLAIHFYNRLLMKQCFRKLFNNYFKSKENSTLAAEYYVHKQKCWAFKAWKEYVEIKFKVKYDIADTHYRFKALTRAFNNFKENTLESKRSMQVAEDIYDFRLTSNTFIHWHRYVCKQFMLDQKKTEIAVKHNNRRLLFQYFYQWKSLPVVIQLEKAIEEKKRKWREKVWEILPDYQPPEQL